MRGIFLLVDNSFSLLADVHDVVSALEFLDVRLALSQVVVDDSEALVDEFAGI